MSSNSTLKMEPSAERSKRVILILIFLAIFFLGSIVFVNYLFHSYKSRVFKDTIKYSEMNSELAKLRAYEKAELDTYGYLNEEEGIVRIPIEDAIKKVVRSYK